MYNNTQDEISKNFIPISKGIAVIILNQSNYTEVNYSQN